MRLETSNGSEIRDWLFSLKEPRVTCVSWTISHLPGFCEMDITVQQAYTMTDQFGRPFTEWGQHTFHVLEGDRIEIKNGRIVIHESQT
jgi:hypothetical protein